MERRKSNPAASAIREFFLLSSHVGKYCGGAPVAMMAPPLALGRNIPSSRACVIGNYLSRANGSRRNILQGSCQRETELHVEQKRDLWFNSVQMARTRVSTRART